MVVKAQQVRDCYHPIHEKSLPKALPMNECVKAELYSPLIPIPTSNLFQSFETGWCFQDSATFSASD